MFINLNSNEQDHQINLNVNFDHQVNLNSNHDLNILSRDQSLQSRRQSRNYFLTNTNSPIIDPITAAEYSLITYQYGSLLNSSTVTKKLSINKILNNPQKQCTKKKNHK